MFQLNAGGITGLICRCNGWIAIIGGEGHEGNQVKDRFACTILASVHISNVLGMTKGLGGELGEKDRKLGVRWHVLHIDRYCIEVVSLWILKNSYQRGGIGKKRLEA